MSIPVWIKAVSIRNWKKLTKKIAILILVFIATSFTIFSVTKPYSNPTPFALWAFGILISIYYLGTLVSAYFSWPRQEKSFEKLSKWMNKKQNTSVSTRKISKNLDLITLPRITGTDGNVSVAFINATFRLKGNGQRNIPIQILVHG
ncbi:MAG: hypothetical protein ACOYY3_12050 [Chloroflexota bacterium]